MLCKKFMNVLWYMCFLSHFPKESIRWKLRGIAVAHYNEIELILILCNFIAGSPGCQHFPRCMPRADGRQIPFSYLLRAEVSFQKVS